MNLRDLPVRLAVGLAFADASIVVLALPRVVNDLDTTIGDVTWVIMAYGLALIVGVAAFLTAARRLDSTVTLLVGLAVFGAGSLGCSLADSLTSLVALRCVQGVGGALLLCASLPLLADTAPANVSPTSRWAAAAALGAAIGPALGGVLTELFDWRAIFLAQAPVAALAAGAVLRARRPSIPAAVDVPAPGPQVRPGTANVALLLLSAGLIGALFLAVILLINVWLLTPLAAAAVVSAIPLATVLLEPVARGGSPVVLGGAGAVLLALGLIGVALISHRQLGWMVVALALCGAGLGLAFTTLTDAALSGPGSAAARAGMTVVARDAGLVVGLLILTPVFVHDLGEAPGRAIGPIAVAIYGSPLPDDTKDELADALFVAYAKAPEAGLPDLEPAFAAVGAGESRSTVAQLAVVRRGVDDAIERAATRSFRRPLLYSAVFALLVLPVLALRLAGLRFMRARA